MIGRAAYHSPAQVLCGAERRIFGRPGGLSAEEAAKAMIPYANAHVAAGGRLNQVTRHMLGLFAGRPGARAWRRCLSEGAARPGADGSLIAEALSRLEGVAEAPVTV